MDWQEAKALRNQGKQVVYRSRFGTHMSPWSSPVREVKGPMGFGSDAILVTFDSSQSGVLVPRNAEWKEDNQ